MKKEVWKPIVGLETFYDISNTGRVKSKHQSGRPAKNGILSQHKNKKGYLRVGLSGCGKRFSIVVHRLVLEAFIGHQPSVIHQSNHKNGIKSDNRADNLEWLTPIENNAHARKMGLWHPFKGETHGMAKLTESDVKIIRKCQGKEKMCKVAKRYGVTNTAIYTIWKRINWKHIP